MKTSTIALALAVATPGFDVARPARLRVLHGRFAQLLGGLGHDDHDTVFKFSTNNTGSTASCCLKTHDL